MKDSLKYFLRDIIFIILASVLYAIGVAVFLQPAEISPGGITGVATIINYLSSFPTGTAILLLNFPLILVGFIKLGGKLIIKTGIATIISSVFIDVLSNFEFNFTNDKIISALAGGLLLGVGMGVLFIFGATSGGTDIGAKLLKIKYPYFSMGRLILILDAFVISVSGLIYGNLESAMYAALAILVSTTVIDRIQRGEQGGMVGFVITDKPKLIKEEIYKAISRGVSEIEIKGGYSGDRKTMIFCSFRRSQSIDFQRIIKNSDGKSFVIITNASEIYGQGFGNI